MCPRHQLGRSRVHGRGDPSARRRRCGRRPRAAGRSREPDRRRAPGAREPAAGGGSRRGDLESRRRHRDRGRGGARGRSPRGVGGVAGRSQVGLPPAIDRPSTRAFAHSRGAGDCGGLANGCAPRRLRPRPPRRLLPQRARVLAGRVCWPESTMGAPRPRRAQSASDPLGASSGSPRWASTIHSMPSQPGFVTTPTSLEPGVTSSYKRGLTSIVVGPGLDVVSNQHVHAEVRELGFAFRLPGSREGLLGERCLVVPDLDLKACGANDLAKFIGRYEESHVGRSRGPSWASLRSFPTPRDGGLRQASGNRGCAGGVGSSRLLAGARGRVTGRRRTDVP